MSVQGPPEAELTGQPAPPGAPAAELPPAAADPHYARRWLVLAVVLVAQTMILLDGTVVNVALPSAQRDLGFSNASQQWVITAYVLAFGSLLPLGGRLASRELCSRLMPPAAATTAKTMLMYMHQRQLT